MGRALHATTPCTGTTLRAREGIGFFKCLCTRLAPKQWQHDYGPAHSTCATKPRWCIKYHLWLRGGAVLVVIVANKLRSWFRRQGRSCHCGICSSLSVVRRFADTPCQETYLGPMKGFSGCFSFQGPTTNEYIRLIF